MRWRAAIAAGVDYLASDQYELLGQRFTSKCRLPRRSELSWEAVFNSETNDPTGLVTVCAAIAPSDSPRRYIM